VEEIREIAKDIYDSYIKINKDADIKTLRRQVSN